MARINSSQDKRAVRTDPRRRASRPGWTPDHGSKPVQARDVAVTAVTPQWADARVSTNPHGLNGDVPLAVAGDQHGASRCTTAPAANASAMSGPRTARVFASDAEGTDIPATRDRPIGLSGRTAGRSRDPCLTRAGVPRRHETPSTLRRRTAANACPWTAGSVASCHHKP
jgi:hypothetical protein